MFPEESTEEQTSENHNEWRDIDKRVSCKNLSINPTKREKTKQYAPLDKKNAIYKVIFSSQIKLESYPDPTNNSQESQKTVC